MRKQSVLVLILLFQAAFLSAQPAPKFNDYFIDKTMRIDYFHTGDAEEEFITLDLVYEQGTWAGNKQHLIDPFNNGRYCIKVYDSSSKKLIFSRGFDSYFGEYKTTDQALKRVKRTYHESALIPYPKENVLFTVEFRNRQNHLQLLFFQEVDADGVGIIRGSPERGVSVFTAEKNGDPGEKVDLAFIGEGYTSREEVKFRSDVKRFTKIFFKHQPYRKLRGCFNVYGVLKPSQESGCDEPTHRVFKNTSLNATFNSLGSERYLLTEDNKSLRDIAAHVPYDALVIMVNHKRYGGGGIYNSYCTFTVDNEWREYLFIHEFGHSFGGLADEYYTSSVAYSEFYARDVEPTEPNITALLDPANLKWKNLLTPGIEIPTPWEKEEFDRVDSAFQQVRRELNERIARLKREGAPETEIRKTEHESALFSSKHVKRVDEYLRKSKFWGKVGAFEGAGYASKGLYRPMVDCLMFTRSAEAYCVVCEKAISRVIEHFSLRTNDDSE